MRVRRTLVALDVVIGVMSGSSLAAAADPPGPGDKQCRPGQQGNPHPAHKGGSC
jgi:hypothetical protein